MRVNYKKKTFLRGTKSDIYLSVEGNASVYQVTPLSIKTGEGRAEFSRTWGSDFDLKGGGGGEGYSKSLDMYDTMMKKLSTSLG